MRYLTVGIFILGLATPAMAAAQTGACYDSEVGEWVPVPSEAEVRPVPIPSEAGDSLSYSFPPRIRIDSDGTFSIPEGALPTVHRTMTWVMSGRSMNFRLDWQKGYVGLVGSLEPTDEGWAGYAQSHSHVLGLQRYRRDLTLREIPCDSAPPIPASADTPLPREVRLADGRVFPMGPMGEVALREGRNEVDFSPTPALGFFEGATRIVASVRSGVVVRMDVHFDGGGGELAFDRLAERFGARERPLKGWSNRTTQIFGSYEGGRIIMMVQPSGEPRNPL